MDKVLREMMEIIICKDQIELQVEVDRNKQVLRL